LALASATHDPRLLIGPQIGEDAAVIDAGDRFLAGTVFAFTSLRAALTTIRLSQFWCCAFLRGSFVFSSS
jgi:hypothetical protein